MEPLEAADIEPFREGLLLKARELHATLGMSPRPELAPEVLVEGAIALALRSQGSDKTREMSGPREWLEGILDEHVRREWNDTVAGYLAMLSGYARVRWRAWHLPARRVDPADLVSEAWAKAIKNRGSFRGGSEGEYIVWLQRILENHARDQLDREYAQARDAKREVDDAVEGTSRRIENFLFNPNQSTPSKPLRRQELAARIFAEIDRLPSPQREAVVLTLQGLTRAEVAKELVTVADVSKLILVGLRTLRERLKDIEGGI